MWRAPYSSAVDMDTHTHAKLYTVDHLPHTAHSNYSISGGGLVYKCVSSMPFIHLMTIQRSHMPSYFSEVMEKCLCADGACAIKHCPLFWSLAGEAAGPRMSLEHWKTNKKSTQRHNATHVVYIRGFHFTRYINSQLSYILTRDCQCLEFTLQLRASSQLASLHYCIVIIQFSINNYTLIHAWQSINWLCLPDEDCLVEVFVVNCQYISCITDNY